MASEFSIRSDSVDVEQIMKQIRERIREKRGVDYTEEEIRELANVKLERFLDPARLRSELLQQYRARHAEPRPIPVEEPPTAAMALPPVEVPGAPENYAFDADAPYQSSRGLAGWLLFKLRRLLNPLLKLFINPTPIVHVLAMQSAINARTTTRVDTLVEHVHQLTTHLNNEWLQWLRQWQQWQHGENLRSRDRAYAKDRTRHEVDALNYELVHNLVLELTRLSMDVKNMKMRVESISSRLDLAERRTRSLEAVVQYRPGTGPAAEAARATVAPGAPTGGGQQAPAAGPDASLQAKGDAQRRRRRRRRNRSSTVPGAPGAAPGNGTAHDASSADSAGDLFEGQAGAEERATPGDDAPAPEPETTGRDRHDPDSTS